MTGAAWESVAGAAGSPKHIVCNAAEEDLGSFLNRALIEGDPHAVIEGMAIAGYATGAGRGHIYLNAVGGLAERRLLAAVAQASERGFLGDNILGSGHSFRLRIRTGTASLVAGDGRALVSFLTDEPDTPQAHRAGNSQGAPALLGTAETYANVAPIIAYGPDWLSQVGLGAGQGTKLLAISGRGQHTGVVEVPLGTSLQKVVDDIGGGVRQGNRLKAVQVGGPLGCWIPPECLDTPIDYGALEEMGSGMETRGLFVVDDSVCIPDLVRYFLTVVRKESCGTCLHCRLGLGKALDTMGRICSGKGREGDVAEMLSLAETIEAKVGCRVGKGAVRPLQSSIRYFRDEFEEHIGDRYCRAGACTMAANASLAAPALG